MSEIRQRLSADNSVYRSVMNASERIADQTGKGIAKKLDLKAQMNAVAAAIGFNITSMAENVARVLTGVSKDTEEALKNIADLSERAASATERLIALRQTDAQQIETAEKATRRLRQEMEQLNAAQKQNNFGPFGLIQRGSALDVAFGLSKDADAAKQLRLKEIEVQLAETAVAVEQKKGAVQKANDTEEMAAVRRQIQEDDKRATATQNLADFEREQRRAKMSDEDLLVDLEKERRDVAKQISEAEKFTKEGGTLTAQGVEEVLENKKKQLAIEQRIAEVTANKGKNEQVIGAQVESNIEKWTNLKGVIESVGRGDRELSDRELERKIATLQADIAAREQRQFETGNYDILLGAQRGNLQQTAAELDFRRSVQRRVAFAGEERAFREFGGLSEERLRQIVAERGPTTGERLTKAVDRFNHLLDRGIRIVDTP
jgi:enoyl-[acyl-carrier-protein] reductase (NADH)